MCPTLAGGESDVRKLARMGRISESGEQRPVPLDDAQSLVDRTPGVEPEGGGDRSRRGWTAPKPPAGNGMDVRSGC